MRQLIPVLIMLIALNTVLTGCGNDPVDELRALSAETGQTIDIKVTDSDGNLVESLTVTPEGVSGSFSKGTLKPAVEPETASAAPPGPQTSVPTTPILEPLSPADLEAARGARASLPDRQ